MNDILGTCLYLCCGLLMLLVAVRLKRFSSTDEEGSHFIVIFFWPLMVFVGAVLWVNNMLSKFVHWYGRDDDDEETK